MAHVGVAREPIVPRRPSMWMATLLVLSVGCTTALYGGPTRSSSEVARIVAAAGTTIGKVDNRLVQGNRFTAYEVEPGARKLVASLKDDSSLTPALRKANMKPPTLCFEAEASHSYEVSVAVIEGRLKAAINDMVPGFAVAVGGTCGSAFPDPESGWYSDWTNPIYMLERPIRGE